MAYQIIQIKDLWKQKRKDKGLREMIKFCHHGGDSSRVISNQIL